MFAYAPSCEATLPNQQRNFALKSESQYSAWENNLFDPKYSQEDYYIENDDCDENKEILLSVEQVIADDYKN